jgi:hypothetical protein
VSIGKLFHVAHLAEDLPLLDAWYDRVFAPVRGVMDGHYAPGLERMGSLLVIGDGMIEAMAPSAAVETPTLPIGRFHAKFGRHWHSVAWYCDDVGLVWDSLVARGVRVVTPAAAGEARPREGAIYTHAKDTFTQLEFFQPSVASGGPHGPGPFKDPRFEPGWAERWRSSPNPLGIERMASVTIVVTDLDRATEAYREGVGATLLWEGTSLLTGCRSAYVGVGPETVVELALPTEPDGLAGRELAAHGPICHAVTFSVVDLDRVVEHLGRVGVAILARDDTTILADPADTFGAPFRFTSWRVPGDPRD